MRSAHWRGGVVVVERGDDECIGHHTRVSRSKPPGSRCADGDHHALANATAHGVVADHHVFGVVQLHLQQCPSGQLGQAFAGHDAADHGSCFHGAVPRSMVMPRLRRASLPKGVKTALGWMRTVLTLAGKVLSSFSPITPLSSGTSAL